MSAIITLSVSFLFFVGWWLQQLIPSLGNKFTVSCYGKVNISSNSSFFISISKLLRYWKISSFKYDITLKITRSQIPSYNQ